MGKATQASSLTLEETERFKADHRGGLHCAMLAKPSDIKKPHRVYRCHVHGRPGLSVQQVEQRPRPDALQAEQTWVLLQAPHQRAGGYCGVRWMKWTNVSNKKRVPYLKYPILSYLPYMACMKQVEREMETKWERYHTYTCVRYWAQINKSTNQQSLKAQSYKPTTRLGNREINLACSRHRKKVHDYLEPCQRKIPTLVQ